MARTRIKKMIERRRQVSKTLATILRMEVNSLVRFLIRLGYIPLEKY